MSHTYTLDCMCEYCKILRKLRDKPNLSQQEIHLLIDTYACTRNTQFTFQQKCFLAKMIIKHDPIKPPYTGEN
jgi:hypothetical protein